MNKKGWIILISVFVLGILFGMGKFFYSKYKDNAFEANVISEYNFEISYPKAYKDAISNDVSSDMNNVLTKESGEIISEYMENLNLVEVVKNLKNESNGIKLNIEAIYTEKTSLDLEEICKRYAVMFKIYNEERVIKENINEIINIGGYEAGKVTLKVKGEKEDAIVIAYLLSLEDREITVKFIGSESMILKNEKEINKIINSLKIY